MNRCRYQYEAETKIRNFEEQREDPGTDIRLDILYQDLQAYNQKIYEEKQSGLADPFSYETPGLDLQSYGLKTDQMGVLRIPKMNLEIPIYFGAGSENLERGAGILGQTSFPLGEKNSNTVLAAHRGWKGIPMFLNIQELSPGDEVEIRTFWEILTYQVSEIKIIDPAEIEQVLIQEDRDLVTLLTCHPLAENYQRYLVIAERK